MKYDLTIYYQNTRSLCNKITDLSLNISLSSHSIDVLIFTETWLSSSIADTELLLNGYIVYRHDRSPQMSNFKGDGETLIAVRNLIEVVERIIDFDIKQVFLRLKCGEEKMLLGVMYLPSKSPLVKY